MEDIGLFEAIYSLPQITRYKADPVPREAIERPGIRRGWNGRRGV
jgi:hypothetical protein